MSRLDTPLWESLQRAVGRRFPEATLAPNLHMGFTDSRVYRELGTVAYGAGLFSPDVDSGEFARRFHGHNERIDVESLRLNTELWPAVAQDQIGRASCRERGCQYVYISVVAGLLKKK